MPESSASIKATFAEPRVVDELRQAINSASSATWELVRSKLPKRGLVDLSSVDIGTGLILENHLPDFQRVFRSPDLTTRELSVFVDAGALSEPGSRELSLAVNDATQEELDQIAALLKRAGATKVEAMFANGHKVEHQEW